ncbi:hypothetical protein OAS39_03990 [Pirellulales bacterium]|nr:hypothetical protein [Pirellulales bacterium]
MSETHVSIHIIGKELKFPNKSGKWVRWNVYAGSTYLGGRTGMGLASKRPLHLVINPDTPTLRFEAYLTSEKPKGTNASPPAAEPGTCSDWKFDALKDGGELFLYLSRKRNRWYLKKSTKKMRKKAAKKGTQSSGCHALKF